MNIVFDLGGVVFDWQPDKIILRIFDGVVISCRIQKVKPEIAIYKYLLKQFDLHAAETIFIDDTEQNLATAATVGIQTIQFVNPTQCRRDLEELKCI